MAFSLASVLREDLPLMDGASLIRVPGAPPTDLTALAYQFIILLTPYVASVCLCLRQLEKVAPVGRPGKRHQARYGSGVTSTFKIRPSRADCNAFSIKCLAWQV